MSFSLHPVLAKDTLPVHNLALSRVLLMNDVRFPWLILVPMRDAIREVYELSIEDRTQLMEEISSVAQAFQAYTHADKINIALLGNQVPQLHAHIIARFKGDDAWPNPVWSAPTARRSYTEAESRALVTVFKRMFQTR